MKKKLLLLLLFVQLTLPLTTLADTMTVNNITYETNDADMTASITGYSSAPIGDLVLPNTVSWIGGEYTVTSIGSSAFYSCSSLTAIDFPDSIIEIGSLAFSDCLSLTSVDFPDSLTVIGSNAFENCSSLTAIDLPEGLTEIGSWAFNFCSSLTAIDLPEGLTEIGSWAFNSCSSLTSIDLPESLTEIGEGAFCECTKLTDIKVNWETPLTVTVSEVFSTYSTATLTVPTGSLEAYQADSFWGQFYNIVEDSTLSVEDNLMDETKVYTTTDGKLIISGAVDGIAVKVYNLNGVNVANGVVLNGTAQIELPTASGIYIVTVGNQSYKIVR